MGNLKEDTSYEANILGVTDGASWESRNFESLNLFRN